MHQKKNYKKQNKKKMINLEDLPLILVEVQEDIQLLKQQGHGGKLVIFYPK